MRFATKDGPEWTYGGLKTWDKASPGTKVTRPDRILTNKIAADLVTGFEVVRTSSLPGHLPLKVTLQVDRLHEKVYRIRQPRAYPVEQAFPRDEEDIQRKAVEIVLGRKADFENARAAGQTDRAWEIAASIAEDYLEWRCEGVDTHTQMKGERGRCKELRVTSSHAGARGAPRGPDNPWTERAARIDKARRQAVEIAVKLKIHGEDMPLLMRCEVMALWRDVQTATRKFRLPCMHVLLTDMPDANKVRNVITCLGAISGNRASWPKEVGSIVLPHGDGEWGRPWRGTPRSRACRRSGGT